jgi:hypothetical protein
MKKIGVLLLLCSIAAIGFSQTGWRVVTGLNMAKIREWHGDEAKRCALPGGFAGIEMTKQLNRKLDFVTGAVFSMKGTQYEGSLYALGDFGFMPSGYFREVVRLNYIDIPLLFRYNFRGDCMDIFVQAGPSVSIGVIGKIYHRYEDIQDYPETENHAVRWTNSFKKYFPRFETGLNFGFGLRKGRYSASVSHYMSYAALTNADNFGMKTTMMQFGLGYNLMK